ncbi:YciI family protein [Pseudoalteromonas piscicida]|uniref:YciI family protein n=1 Tax=Pseudoalteromonas piscicida TaxID=43662 RepID=UPI0032C1D4BA
MSASIFIVNLTYVTEIEQVEPLLAPHIAFLERFYANGTFIASGRKVPRTGGVILAKASSEAELLDVVRQDPFYVAEVARYDIIEFVPSKFASCFTEVEKYLNS